MRALRELPGALLISGPDAALPPGVHAPEGARGFVSRLFAQAGAEDGAVAGAPDPAVAVIAPLAAPLTGREAAVQAAQHELHTAAAAQATAATEVEAADRDVRARTAEHHQALAAAEAERLDTEVAAAGEKLADARREHRTLAGRDAALVQEWLTVTKRLATMDADRERADRALKEARDGVEQAEAAVRDLESAQRERMRALAANPYAERLEEAVARAAALARDESTLRKDAGEALMSALLALGINPDDGSGVERHDPAIRQVVTRRRRFVADDVATVPSSFTEAIAPLRDYLAARAPRDAESRERIIRAQTERTHRIEALTTGLERAEEELDHLAEAIESSVRLALAAVQARYDALDRESGGFGAELRVDLRPPGQQEGWTISVEPRWARGPGERPVGYRRPGNTAMKKQRTINLVLAALLGDEERRSAAVLILDELGDSLGQEHRLQVLRAIARTARERGITVLATCQDSMLDAAGRFAGEIVYFCFAGGSELVNRAPVLYGYDEGRRVRMTAEALLAGRPLV